MHWKTVLAASRPKFLCLAPVCVCLGASASHSFGNVDSEMRSLSPALFLACLILAALAHAAVNLLNEYADAKSRLDEHTIKTPFSGGSGALQTNPQALHTVFLAGLWCILVCVLIGSYIIYEIAHLRMFLLVLGIVGLTLVISYTPWINRSAVLCFLAPGLGFGIVITGGTYAVLSAHMHANFLNMVTAPIMLLCSLVFLQVNNLLLINQFPDAVADKRAGRNHMVIKYGYKTCAGLFAISSLGIYTIAYALWQLDYLPDVALICFIGIPFSIEIFRRAYCFKPNMLAHFLPAMALNVILSLLIPIALAIILYVS
ncbi:prenyltransferase [Ningiella sp. W23]|uniref:prenyltransferase n=1 Tax=Ningiella sp. W23 TaxID=3023715 RepID=UPI003756BED2